MKNIIKTLEPNLLGRDFVIGDLHGAYSAFQNLLKNINFDERVDRMISVGDLVDRGPSSLACLSLIREAWFHSVLSNHEQMMIEKFNGGYMGQYWYRNGGMWGMDAYVDHEAVNIRKEPGRILSDESFEIAELVALTEELPFLITVNTKDGKKFHILHAELPDSTTEITDKLLEDPTFVKDIATVSRNGGDAFLWSRYLYRDFYSSNLSNHNENVRKVKSKNLMFNDELSHIISGHTIVQKPLTIVGQTNIDTCAYGIFEDYPHTWNGLTCVELNTWKFYKATTTTFEEVNPVVITAEDLGNEFA